jgi:hypothetical protein
MNIKQTRLVAMLRSGSYVWPSVQSCGLCRVGMLLLLSLLLSLLLLLLLLLLLWGRMFST